MTPTRAVSNRRVNHTITLVEEWSSSATSARVLTDGPREDWSWQDAVADLERKWPNGRVTVHRGLGRHRRLIYATPSV